MTQVPPPGPSGARPPRAGPTRATRTLFLIAPVAATALAYLLVTVLASPWTAARLARWAVATFFALGKFTVLAPLWGKTAFTSLELALLVIYLDLAVAFFVAFNVDVLFRIPHVGPRLLALQQEGARTLAARPWMRRMTFLGVVLFVMFPLTGTGAIGGSILGRLLGLSRARILLAIAAGSVIGAGGMAAFASTIHRLLGPVRDRWWFQAIGIVLLLALVAYVARKVYLLKPAPTPGGDRPRE